MYECSPDSAKPRTPSDVRGRSCASVALVENRSEPIECDRHSIGSISLRWGLWIEVAQLALKVVDVEQERLDVLVHRDTAAASKTPHSSETSE